MPSLGLLWAQQQHFRKICEDFRCLLVRSDAPKIRGGQRLHLEQLMAKHTEEGARSGSRGTAQHHTQPRKSTACRQLQGQARQPRDQVQVWMQETGDQMQMQLLCNCSLKSAPAFLLISPVSPPSFSAKNSIFQLPSNAMPLPVCWCLPRVEGTMEHQRSQQ